MRSKARVPGGQDDWLLPVLRPARSALMLAVRTALVIAALVSVGAPALAAAADPALISLENAVDSAMSEGIEMASARNALRSAVAGVRSADTAPNPLFSLGATSLQPGRRYAPGLSRSGDDVARIDLPIELGGKRRERVAAAGDARAAAGFDVADAGRQVRAAVTGAWFDLEAAERRETLYAGIADSYRQSQTLAERRLAAGAIAAGDLARQRVEMLRAQSDLSRAATARREAQLALSVLIGREADAGSLHTIGDAMPQAMPAATDPDLVADGRPDVRAADARVSSARHGLYGARALRTPDISVGVQYEHDANGLGDSVGLGFSVPLQVRNRYGGVIDAAGVDLAQAEANAAKVRAVAIAEIMTARAAAADAGARRARYDDDLLPSARKAAATAEFAYARGALALVDLLDARRTLQAVELAAIDARTDEAKAIARRIAAETPEDPQ